MHHRGWRGAALRVGIAEAAARARAVVGVRVDVDEAGATNRPRASTRAPPSAGHAAHAHHAVAADADVGVERGIAAPVEHAPAGDEDVERVGARAPPPAAARRAVDESARPAVARASERCRMC
jgi:hypothetical protein